MVAMLELGISLIPIPHFVFRMISLIQRNEQNLAAILSLVPLPVSLTVLSALSNRSASELKSELSNCSFRIIEEEVFLQSFENLDSKQDVSESSSSMVDTIFHHTRLSLHYPTVCPNITDCNDSECTLTHFEERITKYTNRELGMCSYLNLCINDECKYIHFKEDTTSPNIDISKSQWINCDIRNFPISHVFANHVSAVLIDPPWDIHMDLTFGTLTDTEMLSLDLSGVHCENFGGFIFLWATNRTIELSRRCLRHWGYEPIDEIIWVKTNQIGGTVRTGRTGHWLNHAKEHCIVGVKGNVGYSNFGHHRNVSDVIIAPVSENSRKPVEIYDTIEAVVGANSLCLELFGRTHNKRNGWITLGNQLGGTSHITDSDIISRIQ